MPALCSHCSAPDATQRCGNCLETVYCNRECQRAHWKAGGHKARCAESLARLKALSADAFEAPAQAAAASTLSVRELQAALRARGVSTAGLLERAELVQALERAQQAPEAAPPAPAGGSSGSGSGSGGGGGGGGSGRGSGGSGGGGGGSGRASGGGGTAILTGNGLVDMGNVDMSSPLSRAELLDLCRRTGRPSPTPGDAMAYGLLSMRLRASAEGDQGVADWTVSLIKSSLTVAAECADSWLAKVLDERGTTRGLKARATALRETVEADMRRKGQGSSGSSGK